MRCKFFAHGECRSKEAFLASGRRHVSCIVENMPPESFVHLFGKGPVDFSRVCPFYVNAKKENCGITIKALRENNTKWEKLNSFTELKKSDVFTIISPNGSVLNLDGSSTFILTSDPDTMFDTDKEKLYVAAPVSRLIEVLADGNREIYFNLRSTIKLFENSLEEKTNL